jgi:S1-C subfamily serine protease
VQQTTGLQAVFLLVLVNVCFSLPVSAQSIDDDPIGYYSQSVRDGKEIVRDQVVEALNNKLNRAIEANNTNEALVYAESLVAFNALSAQNITRIYALNAQNIAKNGSAGVALAQLGLTIDIELLDEDMLLYFMQLASDNLSLTPLRLLVNEATKRGVVVYETARLLLTEPSSRSDWIKGTVMIKVEQGFTRVNGLMLPNTTVGSGFFIDKQGYLVTNYHVIAPIIEPVKGKRTSAHLNIELWNSGGESLKAELVGYSKINDIALIKSPATPDFVFSFATNGQSQVGQTVFAIGAPGGLASTLTSGLISNTSRELMPIGAVMQIDAAVNPGNSGGPLVNENGEVLGVVFAGVAQFQGINFALSSPLVQALLPRLVKREEAELPFLNLAMHDWSNFSEVIYLNPTSLATNNGLKRGDYLSALAGEQWRSRANFQSVLLQKPIGSLIKLEVKRLPTLETIEIITQVGKRPSSMAKALMEQSSFENLFAPLFGMELTRISRRQYRVDRVLPASIAGQNRFNIGDSFQIIREKQVNIEGREFLLLNIRSLVRKTGVLEGPLGLNIYAPFDNNVWL